MMKQAIGLLSIIILISSCMESDSDSDSGPAKLAALTLNVPTTTYNSHIYVQMTDLPLEGGNVYLFSDDSCTDTNLPDVEVSFTDYGGYAAIYFKFLAVGTYTYSVKIQTNSGAISPCSSFSYTLETPPQPTSILIVGDDTTYEDQILTDYVPIEDLRLHAYSDSNCTNLVATSTTIFPLPNAKLLDIPLGTNTLYFATVNYSNMKSACSTANITYTRNTLITSQVDLTSYSTNSVRSGDFNDDGNLDIATATYDQIEVLLGAGDGTFSSHTTFSDEYGPTTDGEIAVGQINSDSDSFADIVFAKYHLIHYFESNGDGTFASAVSTTIPAGPTSGSHYIHKLRAEDFDNDGYVDIISVNGSGFDGSIMVMKGNGDGTFAAPDFFEEDGRIDKFLLADINNDTLLDIVVPINNEDKIAVYLNDGAGSLSAPTYYTTSFAPEAIAAIDFDQDTDMDLAVTGDSENIQILESSGGANPTFLDDITITMNNYTKTSDDIATADVDNDGNDDLIVVHNGDEFSVVTGNGDATFNAPFLHSTNYYPEDIEVLDLNSDGKDDFIVNGWESGEFGELYIAVQP